MALKVVFVGNPVIWQALKKMRSNWDWQQPIPKIDDFIKIIEGDDDAPDIAISEDTAIIVISDEFYRAGKKQRRNSKIEAFLRAVIECSGTALTIIVSYDNGEKQSIKQDLAAYATSHKSEDLELSDYYWMRSTKPIQDIDAAINAYLQSPDSNEDAKDMIIAAENINPASVAEAPEPVEATPDAHAPDEPEFTNTFKRNAMVIPSTGTKGGIGKTSMALLVGSWIAHSSALAAKNDDLPNPLKVIVVDLDVKDTQIASVLNYGNRTPMKTIMNIIMDGPITQESIRNNVVYDERLQCSFLLGPKQAKSAVMITNAKYEQIINTLKKMYDVVILDTSVSYTDSLFTDVVYPMADEIMFVAGLDRRAVVGISKWIFYIGQSKEAHGPGIPMDKMKIVINMGGKDMDMKTDEIKEAIKMPLTLINKHIPESQWKKPQIIGIVPDIGTRMTKWSNRNNLPMLFNIPKFEGYIRSICQQLLPNNISKILPPVTNVS